MNKLIPVVAGVVSLCSMLQVSAAPAADMKFVTGTHWSQSTVELRKAYLYGIGNMVEMEQAMHDPSITSKNSMVPVLVRGLSPMNLEQVENALTNWYASHPEQADRPVLDVLYTEIALPRL